MARLADDHPQSVRHVFYRMVDPRLPEPVPKTEHGYKQLQGRMAKMHRSGQLPSDWIMDATRSCLGTNIGLDCTALGAPTTPCAWRTSSKHLPVGRMLWASGAQGRLPLGVRDHA